MDLDMNPPNNHFTPGANDWGHFGYRRYSGSASSSGTATRTFKDFEMQCEMRKAFCNAKLHLYHAFDPLKRVDIVQFQEWLKPLQPAQLGQLDAEVIDLFNMRRVPLDFYEREAKLLKKELPARCKTAAKCSGLAFVLLGCLQFEQVAAFMLIAPPALLPCSIAIVAAAAAYICGPYARSRFSCESTKWKLRGVQKDVDNIRKAINKELMRKVTKISQKQLPPVKATNTVPEPVSTSTSRAPNARATPAPVPMQPTSVTEPADVEYPTQTADKKADLTVGQLNSMKAKLQAQADEIAFLRAERNNSNYQVGGAAR